MDIVLYNTLSRSKEKFVPIANTVGMYSCGPTVYNFAHIGNLRTYVFMDLLRRIFSYNSIKVKSVMNITDVGHLLSDADEGEDKMEKAAREQKKSPLEIAQFYTNQFFIDIERLNIVRPTVTPRATDNIKEMIEIVTDLLSKGYAYETEDGIYFSVASFPAYGKLSGVNLDEQLSGARVEVNDTKRHPADFALWKKADPRHIMQWESPWGMGFPGWHIECTAMSKKYLGERFDIHTGGVDHIPIHHENEIAQGEAYTGHKMTNYWLHSEFMLVDGGKMSKSLGNTYTIDQLIARNYSPLDFRYFCLNAQYRQKLNFTFEGLDSAKVAYSRLRTSLKAHLQSEVATEAKVLQSYEDEFHQAINDDLNVPQALGVVWKMMKETKSKDIYNLAIKFDAVFGLDLHIPLADEKVEIPSDIQVLLDKRQQARDNKDFKLSDTLRDEIFEQGYIVKDSKIGQTITKA